MAPHLHRSRISLFLPRTRLASRVVAKKRRPLAQASGSKSIRGLLRNIAYCSAVLMGTGLLATGDSRVYADDTITEIDLSRVGITQPGFRIDGINDRDQLGWGVSGAGDVNGDGLADLIVGAPFADPGGDDAAGESYVIFGNADGGILDVSALGDGGFTIRGIDEGDWSGFSVSGLGDVNGDGLSDVIIGARYGDPNNLSNAGESYVVFGKTDNAAVDLSLLEDGGFLIEGAGADDLSGFIVSDAGDVNGDGLFDIIIGAPDADPGGMSDAGTSYVVFGKDDATTVTLSSLGTNGFQINGSDSGDYSGRSASWAGDVNGDGLADVIIGAPFADPEGRSDSGECYVVFGKNDNAPVELSNLGAGGFQINGIFDGDNCGWSVGGAGDVNGDGFADMVMGATFGGRDEPSEQSPGAVYVVFGKADNTDIDLATLGESGFEIRGFTFQTQIGQGAAGTGEGGDINGDGLADLVIGNFFDPTTKGQGFIIFGKTDNTLISLETLGSGGFTMEGPENFDSAGRSISSAGDVNGDGLADFIIGAPGRNPFSSPDAGEAYVVFSPCSPLETVDYRAFTAAGDTPRVPIGIMGGSSVDSSPDSRAWIDFAEGDNGAGGASLQIATLRREQESELNRAPTVWEISTNRTGWTTAEVTFKYTDEEIDGLNEETLTLYAASSLNGPFEELATTVDAAKNTVSATISDFGFFLLTDDSGFTGGQSYIELR